MINVCSRNDLTLFEDRTLVNLKYYDFACFFRTEFGHFPLPNMPKCMLNPTHLGRRITWLRYMHNVGVVSLIAAGLAKPPSFTARWWSYKIQTSGWPVQCLFSLEYLRYAEMVSGDTTYEGVWPKVFYPIRDPFRAQPRLAIVSHDSPRAGKKAHNPRAEVPWFGHHQLTT